MASSENESRTQTVRSSGRVRRKPETLLNSDSTTTGGKRGLSDGRDDIDDHDDRSQDESMEDSEPDEEELRERRAMQRKKRANTTRLPPQKRIKTDGTTSLAVRTAHPRPRGKVARLTALDAESAGGIFAELFAHGKDAEEVVSQWLARFEQHEASALAEIVNFVLRAAGCTSSVTEEHVADPDNITTVITDLQDEFQATDPTDYPLLKKGKTATTVKQGVTQFLNALVKSIAQTNALFQEPILMENIQAWFCTMSTAANRPFRHTATVVSLVMTTALAEVARDVASEAAKSQRQAETEAKKANKNKARIKDIESKAKRASEQQKAVEALLNDWYTTVFIHRYKDVDAAIRRECASAMGQWIATLPQVFLDGTHLRYLGWMLSDSQSAVRMETVKQLVRLYGNPEMSSGLKSFTERFRSRFAEMATSDAEVLVRTHVIELLDQLRDNGLLEPHDIDAIGKLIFDFDGRVRGATAKFLAEGIKEVCAMKVDELGGDQALLSSLPEVSQDSYDSPRIEWLTLKCLAETLQAYHTQDELPGHVQRSREHGGLVLQPSRAESRFSLAADALYSRVPEMRQWRVIAGYLLFDSSAPRKKRASVDTLSQFKRDCLLSPKEELTLLDVLRVSIKRAISDTTERLNSNKPKLLKQEKAELQAEMEETARDVVNMLPKLLERFGDNPDAASIVLQTQRLLTAELVSDLGQESRAYDSLLEKDRRQFLSHVSNDIPETAARAILQAKLHGTDDIVADKIASLYEETVSRLLQSLSTVVIQQRGSASKNLLIDASDNMLRLVELAKIADPSPAFEGTVKRKSNGPGDELGTPIDIIIALVARAQLREGRDTDVAIANLEDELAERAGELALFYFRWRFRSIKDRVEGPHASDIPYDELEALAARRDTYAKTLATVLDQRRARDKIFAACAGLCIDLQIASSMLDDVKRGANVSDDYTVFIMALERSIQRNIMKAFAGAEAVYAGLAHKRLSPASQQDGDISRLDDDPVSDSDDDDDADTTSTAPRSEEKLKAILLAEQRLCVLASKIVLAVLAGHMDRGSTRSRIEQNKNVLGANFKAVCDFFDHNKATSRKARSKAVQRPQHHANGDAAKKSRKDHAILAESEIEDEIEDDEHGVHSEDNVDMEVESA